MSLAADLSDPSGHPAVWLIIAAAGLTVGALSPVGRPSPPRVVEVLRTAGGLVFYLATARAIYITVSDGIDTWVSRTFLVALTLFFVGAVGVPGVRPVTGLFQRVVFALICVWLIRAAVR